GPRRPLQHAEIKRAVGEVEGFNAKVAVQSSRPTRALPRSSPTPRRFSIAWTPTPRAVSETCSTRFRTRDGRRVHRLPTAPGQDRPVAEQRSLEPRPPARPRYCQYRSTVSGSRALA